MKNKRNSGITLIALVITIVVLLILAGVSIAVLTGENGILTRAKESVNEHSKAAAIEDVKLAWQEIRAEYETREDKNKNKTDYYTKENVSNSLMSGNIADQDGSFIYNELGKSLLIYENNKKEKYNVQIDELGNVTIVEETNIDVEDKLVTTTYSVKIKVGETYKITTSENLRWESSDNSIATVNVVDNEVTISGIKEGESIVTGKNVNDKDVVVCVLTVEKADETSKEEVKNWRTVSGTFGYDGEKYDKNVSGAQGDMLADNTLTFQTKTELGYGTFNFNSFDTGLQHVESLRIDIDCAMWVISSASGSSAFGYWNRPTESWFRTNESRSLIKTNSWLDSVSYASTSTNSRTMGLNAKFSTSKDGTFVVKPFIEACYSNESGKNGTTAINFRIRLVNTLGDWSAVGY